IDDAQILADGADDLGGILPFRPALVGTGHLHPAALVEGPDAGVALVSEDVANRVGAPAALAQMLRLVAWREHAIAVEHPRDAVLRMPLEVLGEDAAHDRSRLGIDLDPVARRLAVRAELRD